MLCNHCKKKVKDGEAVFVLADDIARSNVDHFRYHSKECWPLISEILNASMSAVVIVGAAKKMLIEGIETDGKDIKTIGKP